MVTMATFNRGDVVTVMWKGTPRYGVVAGEAYGDSLPTGASFIPVFMDDDAETYNVDTRIVMLGYHS
jgi:hypothetical protein